MTRHSLPLYEPLITTYNIYGSMTSIISNDTNCWPWMFNNFIQIRYVYDWDSFFFDNHHLLFENCPWLNHHVIPKDFLERKWQSIHQLILESIDLGYYIYFYVDRFYISASADYHQRTNWHETFIYGYDTETLTYLVADNLADGKYIKTECPFDEIENGYANITSKNCFFHNIHLFSKKLEDGYNFNVKQVIEQMKNYLDSKITVDVSFKEKVIFGIQAIQYAFQKVNQRPLEEFFDRRAFHLFWEHKMLMLQRLSFLKKHLDLQRCDELLIRYKDVVDSFEQIRNMTLKYNLKKNDNILFRIERKLKFNLEEEIEIFKEVIGLLEGQEIKS
ncbi:hypothetical protein ACN92M_23865 [Paenibacillus polymyxa]|uniref:hypothetical protein n=1 Tax=Paenibacillus polymyxa TaxID=1406 RepID=UPI000FA7EB98|nr:hypothetical protein H6F38_20375 [Paenibacillus sp. EKM208P]